MAQANAALSEQLGVPNVDYRSLPPPVQAAAAGMVQGLGTEEVRIAEDYLMWATQRQVQGLDASQSAYLREQGWKQDQTSIYADMGTWGMHAAPGVNGVTPGAAYPVYPTYRP
jgi:hypothetical protein